MRRPARFSVRLDRALQPRPPAGGSGRQAQAHLLAACVRVAVPRPPLLTHPTPPPPVPTLCHQGGGGAGALARLAAQRDWGGAVRGAQLWSVRDAQGCDHQDVWCVLRSVQRWLAALQSSACWSLAQSSRLPLAGNRDARGWQLHHAGGWRAGQGRGSSSLLCAPHLSSRRLCFLRSASDAHHLAPRVGESPVSERLCSAPPLLRCSRAAQRARPVDRCAAGLRRGGGHLGAGQAREQRDGGGGAAWALKTEACGQAAVPLAGQVAARTTSPWGAPALLRLTLDFRSILQTLAYPFDVCRRRLQVSGWSGAKNLHAGEAALQAKGGGRRAPARRRPPANAAMPEARCLSFHASLLPTRRPSLPRPLASADRRRADGQLRAAQSVGSSPAPVSPSSTTTFALSSPLPRAVQTTGMRWHTAAWSTALCAQCGRRECRWVRRGAPLRCGVQGGQCGGAGVPEHSRHGCCAIADALRVSTLVWVYRAAAPVRRGARPQTRGLHL